MRTYYAITWPSTRLRVPKVWTGPVETTDAMLFVSTSPESSREVAMADDVYARGLADLNLESPGDIGRFVETCGNPGSSLWRTRPTWGELQEQWRAFLEPEQAHLAPRDLPTHDQDEIVRQIAAHRGTMAYEIAEFVERARLLRDITRVHQFRLGHLTLSDVQQRWESRCTAMPEDDAWALAILYVTLNWSLGAFQPLLQIVLADDGVVETPRFETALPGHQPRLFDALSLQLFNDIAGGTEYRVCANEPCRRLFPIVPKGQRVKGASQPAMRSSARALCCSDRCTKAHAQRELRRRRAEAKREEEKGDRP